MAAPETSTAAGSLQVVVISPERTIFEGMADSVIAPAFDGELGILRGHAPLMTLLGSGDLRVRHAGKVEHFHVEGGFLQVVDDVVTVLSERAEIAA
jgi:F-type H+-transporting ATPase subunit epsilon